MQKYVHGELTIKYSFPFKICGYKGFYRVYIFGAGKIGRQLQEQLDYQDGTWDIITNIGFIDNFVDNEAPNYNRVKEIGVFSPSVLKDSKYDAVVLACKPELIPEICECLFKNGVDSSKILLPNYSRPVFYSPDMGDAWNHYYQRAEDGAIIQYEESIAPLLESIPDEAPISYQRMLDFPSGRGRMAQVFIDNHGNCIEKLVCCDANSDAIDYCRERFAHDKRFDFLVNKVDEWRCIPLDFQDESFTFILSWDAMVHFSYKWIDFYINEIYRMLENGGYALVHHSNMASPDVVLKNKSETWNDNPGGRTPVSAEDVKWISERCGFRIVKQTFVDIYVPNMDCVTLLYKDK